MKKQHIIGGLFDTDSNNVVVDNLFSDRLTDLVAQQVEKEQAFRFLIYANAVAFLVIFLAANGLGVDALITVVVWVYSLFSIVLMVNLFSAVTQRLDRWKYFYALRLGLSYLIYDCALAGILLVNSFAAHSAPTPVAVMAIVMAGFMSLAISPRSIFELAIGKLILLIVSLFVLLTDPGGNVTLMFPLLIAFVLMSVPAYWIFVMRIRVMRQHLEQQHMMGQLQKETNLRERLLVYVGHDLRQPINALGMLLHALPKDDQNVIEAKECVRSSKRLISDIVQISDFEKELNTHHESFTLQSLFDSIKLEYSFAANQADCRLRLVDTSLAVNNDPKLVARIIKNFVANAITHAAGSTILIGVRRRTESIDILVIDDGPGINDADKVTLFDEFVKGESSSSKIGFGLGLAIAKHYANVCQAEILFTSVLGHGTMFGLRLPIDSTSSN